MTTPGSEGPAPRRDRLAGFKPGTELRVTRQLVIPDAELSERFSRSSGPGGQGVNTTSSRVELSFDVARSPSVPEDLRERLLDRLGGRLVNGVLTIAASEHRAQLANREAARQRLAAVLREAAAPPPRKRRPTKPSRGAKERRLAEKKRRGDIKRGRGGRHDD
ncbi:alternative ribosome rescue aminoacyl-tRNA hydrolase ArfB [Qaidamihabitans albus]|uniref:alternative ribosome rescue aminoacyl-tRNA hydrolase ArfB n=1 Tax=Qaidamihabitans albus TaxID=2795733 RepID=UPI0018F20A30|nr:alternative ribosome rescue aminoacyl-tRNA hydrolase ArfB [Qaidamihabitans albus]